MSDPAAEYKSQGNDAFKVSNFAEAKHFYSLALSLHKAKDELCATLLCNRAACYLKLLEYDAAITDCTDALVISPTTTKALFRRASAYERIGDNKSAAKDLTSLLHLEPKNAEAVAMMRRVKEALLHEHADSSEVKNILESMKKDSSKVQSGLSALIGLCFEDRNHAMDLYRKGGVSWLCEVINKEIEQFSASTSATPSAPSAVLVSGIRVLAASSNHKEFVLSVVNIAAEDDVYNSSVKRFTGGRLAAKVYAGDNSGRVQLSFVSVCSLLTVLGSTIALTPILLLIMNILKAFPTVLPAPNSGDAGAVVYTVSSYAGKALLSALCSALNAHNTDAFTAITDTLSAFISDSSDYFDTVAKEVDTRMESAAARKKRLQDTEIAKNRSKAHCVWAIECGLLDQLISNIDSDVAVIRQNSANCLGKLINYVDNNDKLKPLLAPYLQGQAGNEEPNEDKRVVELHDYPLEPLTVPTCRLRAALEATLLIANPDLGTWALELPGGVAQLHFLVATSDLRCQEVAAEVICLAAAMESGAALLTSVVNSGTLTTLLHAPSPGIRAAAASTITKLSIKAKALSEDSSEVAQIMNTACSILKAANNPHAASSQLDLRADAKGSDTDALVSFSSMDEVSHSRALSKKNEADEAAKGKKRTSSTTAELSNGVTMTAVERAIESLAAMVGKTYIKEEIVHGSYRVAACVSELVKLDLDVRSTAAYGVAHILASLTVTNRELRAIALADKDISPEQYDQMQELQRIKTRDEAGNVIEEKKEDSDLDTADLCSRRIKRIVACDAIKFLTKFLTSGSAQTKEAAARALRQICVEASVRGAIIQQGALKACCAAACEEDNKRAVQVEAAHAVAKTLITTNPNLLSEHQRLGAIKPLVMLCKDSACSNLQQFETLLALTNVLSCGTAEHEKFAAEKGVAAVHYLIFSEHMMVRRAATEALCNMANSEHLLKLLRVGDKLRLWLGLCEEGVMALDELSEASNPCDPDAEPQPPLSAAEKEELQEKFLTARAAAGTLAVAAGDAEVGKALCEQDCAKTVVAMLESMQNELVHRALILISELVSANEPADADQCKSNGVHLVEGGVVASISVVLKMNDAQLGGLARDAATALSAAINTK